MSERKWPHPDCNHPRCELGKRVLALLEREGRPTYAKDGHETGKAVYIAHSSLNIAQRALGSIYVTAFGLRKDSVSHTGILTITYDNQVCSGSDDSVNWALEILRNYMVLDDLANV